MTTLKTLSGKMLLVSVTTQTKMLRSAKVIYPVGTEKWLKPIILYIATLVWMRKYEILKWIFCIFFSFFLWVHKYYRRLVQFLATFSLSIHKLMIPTWNNVQRYKTSFCQFALSDYHGNRNRKKLPQTFVGTDA